MQSSTTDAHVILRKKRQKNNNIQYVISSLQDVVPPLSKSEQDELEKLFANIFSICTSIDLPTQSAILDSITARKDLQTSIAAEPPEKIHLKAAKKKLIRSLQQEANDKSGATEIWKNLCFGVNQVLKLLDQQGLAAVLLDASFMACDSLICAQLQIKVSAQSAGKLPCKIATVNNLSGLLSNSNRRFKRLAALGIKKSAAQAAVFSPLCSFVSNLSGIKSHQPDVPLAGGRTMADMPTLSCCIPVPVSDNSAVIAQPAVQLKRKHVPSAAEDAGTFAPLALLSCPIELWSKAKEDKQTTKNYAEREARREARRKDKAARKAAKL